MLHKFMARPSGDMQKGFNIKRQPCFTEPVSQEATNPVLHGLHGSLPKTCSSLMCPHPSTLSHWGLHFNLSCRGINQRPARKEPKGENTQVEEFASQQQRQAINTKMTVTGTSACAEGEEARPHSGLRTYSRRLGIS